MAGASTIEWTDASWNPIRGCSRVSAGCAHCYAERVAARFSGPGQPYEGLAVMQKLKKVDGFAAESIPYWTGEVRLVEELLDWPLRWRGSNQARAEERPSRIFVNSMSDLFHEDVLDRWMALILGVIAQVPQHTFQVLTKRAARMQQFMAKLGREPGAAAHRLCELACDEMGYDGFSDEAECRIHNAINGNMGEGFNVGWPMRNLWLGVSVEDQATADERVPLLLQTPAAVRWISAEPLLKPIDLSHDTEVGILSYLMRFDGGDLPTEKLDWVVVGGESGPGARPMHPDWACSLRDQCKAAGVPFFFKQWGEWSPYARGRHRVVRVGEGLQEYQLLRVGKKAAGRLLDGREWNEFPASGCDVLLSRVGPSPLRMSGEVC